MRRAIGVLAAAVLLAGPSVAWAHGELKPGRVEQGTTATLDLLLPSERPQSRTSRVVLAMPEGFTARSCEEPVGWTCSVASDAVEWRDVARVRAETDFFFTVTVASTAGTYTLPVQQGYEDGTVNTFAGPPGSPDEAPLLTVTGRGDPAPSRSSASSPAASRTPSATVTTRPPTAGPARPGTASPVPVATEGSTSPRAPGGASASTAATLLPVVPGGGFARPTSLPRGELLGDGARRRDDDATLPALLAAALVVLVGAAVATRLAADHEAGRPGASPPGPVSADS